MKFLLRYLIIHYNKSIILYDISYITTILSLSNYFEKNEKYYYSTTLPTGWYFCGPAGHRNFICKKYKGKSYGKSVIHKNSSAEPAYRQTQERRLPVL